MSRSLAVFLVLVLPSLTLAGSPPSTQPAHEQTLISMTVIEFTPSALTSEKEVRTTSLLKSLSCVLLC
jgi:hypothetical protein